MKYDKINLNRTPLSAEEISAAMDFDGLINPPASAPAPSGNGIGRVIKLGLYGIGIAAVAVFGFLFLNRNSESNFSEKDNVAPVHQIAEEEDSDSSKESEAVVNPPIEALVKPYLTKSVSASDGGKVRLGSSELTVPSNAFVDENGNVVNGDVDLNYREFNNVLDIYLSGIPMEYDSAGVNYTFESNGMFELRGTQNGNAVFLADDKSIDVSMDVADAKSGFSEYYLNEETGDWEFRNGQKYLIEEEQTAVSNDEPENESVENGSVVRAQGVYYSELKDSLFYPVITNSKPDITKGFDQNIVKLTSEKKALSKPVKPKKADPEIPQLALEVSFKEFPELKGFENTLFQVAEKDIDSFDSKWGEETWNDVAISKSQTPGYYRMIFSRPGKRVKVNCTPVVAENELPQALDIYNNLFDQYETALDSLEQLKKEQERARKEALAKAKEEAEERARIAQEERKEQIKAQVEAQGKSYAQYETSQKIQAVFMVNGFGYYNCDRPLGRIRNAKQVLAHFQTDKGEPITAAVMIEEGRRAIFNRYTDRNFLYSPSKKNMLISVSENNKVSVFKPEKFEEIDSKKCVIRMKECEKELNTRDEIEEFIESEGFDI